MKRKFLRKGTRRISRLGKKRKKKQKWRKPKGRHNKLRLKRKSRGRWPSIGYSKGERKKIIVINNERDLEKKADAFLLGKFGLKKKMFLVKKAEEKNIKFENVKENFLKETEEKLRHRKELVKKKEEEKKKKSVVLEKKAEEKEKEEKKSEEKEKEGGEAEKKGIKQKIIEKKVEAEKRIIKPKSKIAKRKALEK